MIMDRKTLLADMKSSVGILEPVIYFEKMTELLDLLFDKIESLEDELHQVRLQSALAIQWEPKVAANMLAEQIEQLRLADKDMYASEIFALKRAYAEDRVTQEYSDFCQFWLDTLGFHPFLDYTE
jgi:hypothetical protein